MIHVSCAVSRHSYHRLPSPPFPSCGVDAPAARGGDESVGGIVIKTASSYTQGGEEESGTSSKDTATEVAYISVPAPHHGRTFPLPLYDNSDDDLVAEAAVLRPRERADTQDTGAARTSDRDAISRSILLV